MINVKKSQPAPACLAVEKQKKDGDYGCGEVRTRLQTDFFNKCYICGEKNISSVVVEHFIAHGGDLDLKFDWNNLFFACSHCNNIKHHLFQDILKCTDFTDIITECLEFRFESFPEEKTFVLPLKPGTKIQNTADLLNKTYNGKTLNQVIEANNIRSKLRNELIRFREAIEDFEYNPQEKYLEKIKQMLSIESAFTAFKIWIIKKDLIRFEKYRDLLPVFNNE